LCFETRPNAKPENVSGYFTNITTDKAKNMKHLLIIGFVFILVSCGQIMTEAEALKKNEQGLSELSQGQFELAIKSFKEAIQSPKLSIETRAPIYRNIAQIFIEMQLQDSAIHYSTLAANCYKKGSYDYLVNMADIEILTGKTNYALEKLKTAYALKPNELAVNNTIGLIYLGDYGFEFQDIEKALPYNKKAFDINNDRITEYVLARNYYELEQFEKSEIHFTNLNRKYPDYLLHPLSLGMVKYRLKDKKSAEQLWEKVLESDSSYYYVIESFKEEIE